ncbi:MAG: hypothetical protein ACOY94_04675 [Bacillota bacterium]
MDEPVTASSLYASIHRFAASHAYADIGCGETSPDGPWFRYEELADPAVVDRIRQRLARELDTTDRVAANNLFRAAHYLPLAMAGFLFVTERRVPILHRNLALLDQGYLKGIRLLEPRAIVLPTDPAAGHPGIETVPTAEALADALFAEVARTVEPVLATFLARKLVSQSNAWGMLIDSLAYGALAGGRVSTGTEAAWELWSSAVAGRSFPVRRRPRLLRFDADGRPAELMVRAHCCLYYTLDRVKQTAHPYCTSCYLETDANRIERTRAELRSRNR